MPTPSRPAFVTCEGSGTPVGKRTATIFTIVNDRMVVAATEYGCPDCDYHWRETVDPAPTTTVRPHQRQEGAPA